MLSISIAHHVHIDALSRHRVQRQVADLVALAVDLQVLHASALLQVAGLQQAQFLTSQAVVKQCRQNRPVAQPL